MRPVHAALLIALFVLGASSAIAQPYRPVEGQAKITLQNAALRAQTAEATTPAPAARASFIDALTHNFAWIPGVLVFLAALIKRDRGAWWFAFLAAVATIVIFGAPSVVMSLEDWLQTTVGTLVGTFVVLAGTFGLFVLHQKRLDIFARTEITFGVVGIGYSVHNINESGAWAGLIVSIYGLVEGFTRMRDADGTTSLLAAFDGPTTADR